MARLNIYFILATVKVLKPTSGDKINEIMLIKAISKFANVYYNDQLVDITKSDLGLKELPIKVPSRKYDLYYVRNNRKLFLNLPQPKLWLGSPYDETCFAKADAIVTLTESWTRRLANFKRGDRINGIYSQDIIKPKYILTLPQCNEDHFRPYLRSTPRCQEIRKLFGGDFIIGHFGKIAKSSYPYSLLQVLPKLIKKFSTIKIRTVFCGLKNQSSLKINSPYIAELSGFNTNDMPYAISACDVIVCNHRVAQSHIAGSRRIIEAIACGIPIVCGDFDARKEQLGDDYELFWEFRPNKGRISDKAESQMLEHLVRLIKNKKFRKMISKKLIKRSQHYKIDNISKICQNNINQFLTKLK